jgi:hypothetical protein
MSNWFRPPGVCAALVLAALIALPPGPAGGQPTRPAADDKKVAVVHGKVSVNGKPVAKGKVVFHPEKGKPVSATIKDGDYSAKDVPPGKLRVTVEAQDVPKQYGDPRTTPVSVMVKEGRMNLDINLSK